MGRGFVLMWRANWTEMRTGREFVVRNSKRTAFASFLMSHIRTVPRPQFKDNSKCKSLFYKHTETFVKQETLIRSPEEGGNMLFRNIYISVQDRITLLAVRN